MSESHPSHPEPSTGGPVAPEGPVDSRPALLRQDIRALTADLQRAGFSAFRAKQIFHWIYRHGVESPDEMTNVPADVRHWLVERYRFGGGRIVERRASADGSVKFLFELHDGNHIESVLMPETPRTSLCVSSQVGCALGCRFCLTGKGGFVRDCTSDEIVAQFLAARRESEPAGRPITHVVFMGMGEPLLNCDEVFEAIRRLIDPQAIGISSRRITVSTVGVVEGIRRLGEAGFDVKLAVSLNATTDEQRAGLMPYNRRDDIASLLEACRRFPMPRRHRITFEYVLIDGINDSPRDARRLAGLLHGIRCKVNLIPYNPVPDLLPYRRPPEERVEQFQQILIDKNYTANIRYSKGGDVGAACGQLAGHIDARLPHGKWQA